VLLKAALHFSTNIGNLVLLCLHAFILILHRSYVTPILDKLRAGDCFRKPLQQLALQPPQTNAQVDEDVAAEASRVNSHNENITDILELRRFV
jgi:hypothetical protein